LQLYCDFGVDGGKKTLFANCGKSVPINGFNCCLTSPASTGSQSFLLPCPEP
jgi:hypothetical protein